ncbi:MAG: HAD family hydrolase [Roseobacter sp.]|jgi:phosphoglycolate phosphatase
MNRLRGIIFDKDGTLFEFSQTWEAWAHAFLNRIAGTEDRAIELGRTIGFDLRARRFEPDSIVIAGTPRQVAAALGGSLPHLTMTELVDIINEEASNAPQAEVVALSGFLQGLQQDGFQLGVVTNDAEGPARAHLQSADILALFGFVAGSDSGYGAKPEPGQLLACASAMGLPPKEVLMVGDSTHDLIAAQRAGMPAVGVLTGLATAETLAPFSLGVLPHIGHLPAWLKEHRPG